MMRLILLPTLVLGLALLAATVAPASTIYFTPASTFAEPGNTFSVTIEFTGVETSGLGAYDLDFEFNSAILKATVVDFGTYLGGPTGSIQFETIGAGSVDLAEVSLLPSSTLLSMQPGTFPLATITFLALADGVTPVDFGLALAVDANGQALNVTTTSATVAVGAPEPRSAIVAPAGLGLLLFFAWRRRVRESRSAG